jgi:acylphosphatase
MKPLERQHVTIRVSGRVQQVFYRASAKNVAEGLGINGFAQNNLDGSVTIEAEGITRVLEEFVRWCETGPAQAEVVHLDLEPGGMQHFTEFQVR